MITQSIRLAALRLIGVHSPLPMFRYCGCRPLEFGDGGLEALHMETLARLEHLYSLGVYYREQMEAAEAECCELMGFDPEYDSIESGWAREIVAFGVPVSTTIERIDDLRREESTHADL